MKRFLVTGGTGHLGSEIVPRLEKHGHIVRVMSRSASRLPTGSNREWAQADVKNGAQLEAALDEVDVVIHAASEFSGGDVEEKAKAGTGLLLEKARQAGVKHFVYISIVGIDKIPFSYYEYKLAEERLIEQGGVPWTILRAPQFYSLVDAVLQKLASLPIMLVPAQWQVQPMDDGEAADQLVTLALQEPAGHVPDIGGPEVLTVREIAPIWRQAHHVHKPMLYVPFPGKLSAGFRRGDNTVPHHPQGKITWKQWVEQRTQSQSQAVTRRQHQGS